MAGRLTERGAALVSALDGLARWAEQYLPAEPGRGAGC
ncbi:winged helix-turn-helix transcriptional regulator [Micromonospora rhizosphaerae]|nr:winged helix-turn-helix transcriptional regulator [Micromonospora rhizosphaerae]